MIKQMVGSDIEFGEGDFHGGRFNGVANVSGPFDMLDAPVGGAKAPAAVDRPGSLQGSRLAVFSGDVLVVDEESGKLVRTDRDGKSVGELEIGRDAGQTVVDAKASRAYVADRSHDRVVVVDLADGLRRVDAFSTSTEPYGLALSPDRKTLLVTTVADRSLSALDTETGLSRWSLEVGPEPRGVAISPKGDEALVTFLTTGAVARVELGTTPKAAYIGLEPAVRSNNFNAIGLPIDATSDEGRVFARNAFATAYLGNDVAVVAHQLSTPHLATQEFESEAGGYGGGNGFTSPVEHRLAFMSVEEKGSSGVQLAMAATNLHQPRALAYDAARDTLFVAGYGSDDVLAIADASQASVHFAWQQRVVDGSGCGPDALAVDPDDGQVVVWCSLTRRTVRLAPSADVAAATEVARSSELATSRFSGEAQRGRALFREGRSPVISTFGAMACASCHAEARTDGLSWRLQGKNLQTPLLLGRLEDAHPFKWDGKDPDLKSSLTNTVTRLGGTGLNATQVAELDAYLTALEPPRAPKVADAHAVERGKDLFESDITGCATCHDGPLYTDKQAYDLAPELGRVDTPSLVGLSASAPYYHDGSAATLGALLRGNASIHGMGDIAALSDADISDLVQYLETL